MKKECPGCMEEKKRLTLALELAYKNLQSCATHGDVCKMIHSMLPTVVAAMVEGDGHAINAMIGTHKVTLKTMEASMDCAANWPEFKDKMLRNFNEIGIAELAKIETEHEFTEEQIKEIEAAESAGTPSPVIH